MPCHQLAQWGPGHAASTLPLGQDLRPARAATKTVSAPGTDLLLQGLPSLADVCSDSNQDACLCLSALDVAASKSRCRVTPCLRIMNAEGLKQALGEMKTDANQAPNLFSCELSHLGCLTQMLTTDSHLSYYSLPHSLKLYIAPNTTPAQLHALHGKPPFTPKLSVLSSPST